MPGENIQDWSVTAINNANSDTSIGWAEGQARASVNNSARSMMAAHAKDRNLNNGSIVTGGTANAQTFTSGVTYTAVPTGLRATLKVGPGLTNTGAATLNMDGIGAVAIKDPLGADLGGALLKADTYVDVIYNGTNWMLLANFAAAMPTTLVNIRVFTASGTYPTTTAITKVLVYCKGGGGSGGSSVLPLANGGAGGEGAETWKLTTAAALSAQAVTVGAGGAAINANTNFSGAVGVNSGIGGIITAAGGSGGITAVSGSAGGAGGNGGIGDFTMPGAAGQAGGDAIGTGNLPINAAGGGKGGGGAGAAGVANSGGGGGAGANAYNSGAGGSGIVVCYEYGTI